MLFQEAHEALQCAFVRDGVLMLRLDGQQPQHEARLLLYLLPTGAATPPHPQDITLRANSASTLCGFG